MRFLRWGLASVILLCSLSAIASNASNVRLAWNTKDIVNSYSDTTRLLDREGQVVSLMKVSRVRTIVETFRKIEFVAGLDAELWIVSLEDNSPNAMAGKLGGKNRVLITTSMIELLGDDADAYAYLLGHELAHLVKEHGAQSESRRNVLQGISLIAAFVISRRTGVNVGDLSGLGAELIDRSFSRDQEREADQIGLRLMNSAGYDFQGALRMHKSLLAVAKTVPLAFLSTHPSGEERLANIQTLGAQLPSRVATASLTKSPSDSVAKGSTSAGNSVLSPSLIELARTIGFTFGAVMSSSISSVDPAALAAGCHEGLNKALSANPNLQVSTDSLPFSNAPTEDVMKSIVIRLGAIQNVQRNAFDGQLLLEACLDKLLSRIDRFSNYLNPSEYREFKGNGTAGTAGIGVSISFIDDYPAITPLEAGPAFSVGIHPQDILEEIDGISVDQMGLREIVRKLRGPSDSQVNLKVKRVGVKDSLSFTLRRSVIAIQSVLASQIAPGYGYIRIRRVTDSSLGSVIRALDDFARHSNDGLKGLIVDLRGNPGGAWLDCVGVASVFLSNETLVAETKGKSDAQNKKYKAVLSDYARGGPIDIFQKLSPVVRAVPLVVLVDQRTSSGAEIIAGALQDHGRATIIGTRTAGDGAISSVYPMGNGAALRLTSSAVFRPNGQPIQGIGIIPDIIVDDVDPPSIANINGDAQLRSALRVFQPNLIKIAP